MKRRPSWLAAPVAVASVVGLVPMAAGSPSVQLARPHTILEVRGTIEGFAQDGRYITWANPTLAYGGNRRACPRIVQLRDLRTNKTWPLVAKTSTLCKEIGNLGGFQHRMALAGTRALWGHVTVSNSSDHVLLFTGSRARPATRSLASVSMSGGLERDWPFRPVPVVGDGPSLLFAHTGSSEEQRPYGVFRIGAKTSLIRETDHTHALAAQGGRFALGRTVEPGCICNAFPAWSPDGREIAFRSGRDEGGLEKPRLYLMRADGSDLRRLPLGKGIGPPQWAPTGRELLFERQEERSIFVLNLADGRQRRIAEGVDATWSPDGRWIGYTGRGSEGSVVFRTPAAGGSPRRIVKGTFGSWSPDSNRLVVQRDDGLYVVAADGSQARRLVSPRPVSPRWSPDGRLIAYSTWGQGTWVIEPTGEGRRRISSEAETAYTLTWSPDSRSIARWSGPSDQIILVAADGSGERVVTGGGSPAWSPDGSTLAFAAPENEPQWPGEIGRVKIDGSGRDRLTRTTADPGRNVVEVRTTRTGRVNSTFNANLRPELRPTELALDGSRLALLYSRPNRLEIRTTTGQLLRRVATPRAENLSLSGRWALFRTERMIRVLDTRSGRTQVLTRAASTPVGLSLDGRRVAWAEQLGRRSRIRTVELPR